MKSPLAYYLLLLYLFAICKPLLPVAGDALAHAFWQPTHLAVVHQHQGKNHLHNDLKEAAKQENTDNAASKTSESVSIHLLTGYVFDFSFALIMRQQPFTGSGTAVGAFLEKQIPPPKASATPSCCTI